MIEQDFLKVIDVNGERAALLNYKGLEYCYNLSEGYGAGVIA
jgi:hypothetical protein